MKSIKIVYRLGKKVKETHPCYNYDEVTKESALSNFILSEKWDEIISVTENVSNWSRINSIEEGDSEITKAEYELEKSKTGLYLAKNSKKNFQRRDLESQIGVFHGYSSNRPYSTITFNKQYNYDNGKKGLHHSSDEYLVGDKIRVKSFGIDMVYFHRHSIKYNDWYEGYKLRYELFYDLFLNYTEEGAIISNRDNTLNELLND